MEPLSIGITLAGSAILSRLVVSGILSSKETPKADLRELVIEFLQLRCIFNVFYAAPCRIRETELRRRVHYHDVSERFVRLILDNGLASLEGQEQDAASGHWLWIRHKNRLARMKNEVKALKHELIARISSANLLPDLLLGIESQRLGSQYCLPEGGLEVQYQVLRHIVNAEVLLCAERISASDQTRPPRLLAENEATFVASIQRAEEAAALPTIWNTLYEGARRAYLTSKARLGSPTRSRQPVQQQIAYVETVDPGDMIDTGSGYPNNGLAFPSYIQKSCFRRPPCWIKIQQIRPCYLLIFLAILTIVGSLVPALWRSTKRDDIQGGFSLAQYILGVGVFIIGCAVAIHSRSCSCWMSTDQRTLERIRIERGGSVYVEIDDLRRL